MTWFRCQEGSSSGGGPGQDAEEIEIFSAEYTTGTLPVEGD